MSKLLSSLIFILVPILAFAQTDTTDLERERVLIEKLKQGGFVIYFRHADTDKRTIDVRPVDLDNCRSQRNLSVKGREDAVEIGRSFKRLGLPVGEVFSSPYCRCKDTARLAFGDFRIDEKLYFAINLNLEERKNVADHLRKLLSNPITSDKNRIVVSHTSNLREAVGIWPKREGGAHIFQPVKGASPKYLGSIGPTQWKDI